MKKVGVLALLALGGALCGCGTAPNNNITTTAGGEWEAGLSGGGVLGSQLGFVTGFNVTDTTGVANEPLDITSFGVLNAQGCFPTGQDSNNGNVQSGVATLTTNSSGQVSGSMTYTITAPTGNILTLSTSPNGGVSGTSNGTPTTTGTLSNGVVWGTWTLQSSNTSCIGDAASPITGNFVMCQGAATCTVP